MIENSDWKVFIQANASQRLGALLSKYSIERVSPGIPVEIIQVEEIPAFQQFEGKTYMQGSEEHTYSLDDAQSFTLTRFMPPECMNFHGRAVVIDPDIFAVRDISPLFEYDMGGAAVACCSRDGKFWDTSVMLLKNSILNWRIDEILTRLARKEINYNDVMRKLLGATAVETPRIWNSLDELSPETRMIHYTRQRTQPWKTGLPFTVTRRRLGKVFGIIPKEWLPSGRAKYPKTYQPHPDKEAEAFFFSLVRDALRAGAINEADVRAEIEARHVRPDILTYANTA